MTHSAGPGDPDSNNGLSCQGFSPSSSQGSCTVHASGARFYQAFKVFSVKTLQRTLKHRWERKSLCWHSTQILTAAEPIPRTLLQMSTQRTWKTLVNGFKKHSEGESHLAGCLKESEEHCKDREGNKPTEQIVLKAHDNFSSHTSQLPIRCFPIS